MEITSIESQPIKRTLPYIICGLSAFFYLYEFMVRVMPSAMTHELMRAFHIHAGELGVLSSVFYVSYIAMQIPAGLLFDRFGPRFLLSSAIFLTSLATLWFGLTDNFYAAIAARFLIGFGGSFAFVGALVLASRWFEAKYFAMLAGMVQFLGSIGALLGEQPIAELKQVIGWQATIIWAAVFGFVLTALVWLLVRDHPHASPKKQKQQALENGNNLNRFRIIFNNTQTWWLVVLGFASWAPVTIFGALWGIPFLMSLYHVDAGKAASGLTFFWLGLAFGSPLIGWWSSRINNRRVPLMLCVLVSIIASLIVIYAGVLPWWLMYTVLFFFGFGASSQTLSFGVVQDINLPSVVGSAIGLQNMSVLLSAILCQPLVGYILAYVWDGKMAGGLPVYSVADFQAGLWLIPVISLLGLLVLLFKIKETHGRPAYAQHAHFD